MGTIVNAISVIVGGMIGLLIRRGLPKKVEETAMKLLGLAVFLVGIEGVITSMVTVGADGKLSADGSLLLIASMVIGGVLGELCDIDAALVRGGKAIEAKFGREGFAKGFINASLIFCIGAMAIIGALNDGLTGDPSVLFIKSALDFICSIILGSTLASAWCLRSSRCLPTRARSRCLPGCSRRSSPARCSTPSAWWVIQSSCASASIFWSSQTSAPPTCCPPCSCRWSTRWPSRMLRAFSTRFGRCFETRPIFPGILL